MTAADLMARAAKGVPCRACNKTMQPALMDDHGRCPMCALAPGGVEPKLRRMKRKAAEAELMRRRLLPYVEATVPQYHAGWVHRDICQRLEKFEQDIRDKKSPRLALAMPPRLGKSTLASQNFPTWLMCRNPGYEIIMCGYNADIARFQSRQAQASFRGEARKAAFPKCRIDRGATSASYWMLDNGASYLAAGVDGPLTGFGSHALILDDTTKNAAEAESLTIREAIYEWYCTTAYTRLAPGGGVLAIGTRWNDDDLMGRLIAGGDEYGGGGERGGGYDPGIAEHQAENSEEGGGRHPHRGR
ncbi:MAG: terminase family protein, partial [Chloroflexi bacterium]|nr:terminase family protein [Chloroflexota bacterium]